MDKKTLDKTLHKRKININMPQMHWGGMSEHWLLKELGDIHWSMISEGLGIDSDKLTDSNGERLYSSFVRLRWDSNISLFEIKENCEVALNGKLSRFGNKMFFSDTKVTTSGKSMSASLMSVFSSRTAEDNTTLKKGAPVVSTDTKIKTLSKIPLFAKEYLSTKSIFFSDVEKVKDSTVELSGVLFPINASPIYIQDYTIEPFDDINGVGLIYFASYSKISDKCERNYFHKQNDKNEKWKDWAHNSSCIARDIFYFGNANPNEILVYKLEVCKLIENSKIQLSSSLYRKSDGQLIAKIFTIKQILESITLDSKTQEINRIDEKKIDLKEKEIITNQIVQEGKLSVKSSQETNINNEIFNKEAIDKIVINFLCSVLDEKNIDEVTDLKLLGIESVVYMELSEHLNCEFQIPSNPSRFYGLNTVRDITSYLIGSKSEDIKPIKKTVKHKQSDVESEADTFDVAIIASSFNFPGAKTKEELWKLLMEEKSFISSTPETRFKWPSWVDLSNDYKGIDKAGYITGIDKFDASFFRISPREAELLDPQQRILLELAWELIEESGYKASDLKGSNTGVFIGASGSDYELLLKDHVKPETLTGTGTALSMLANRLSFFYDFNGPSLQIDTACSSSLVAIHEAINSLKLGNCMQVIAGGIHLICHPGKSLSYHQSNMLSPEGKCKTFDQKANGYVRGEGAALLFLKPLSKALEDGDTIHGIIKSSAVNSGGHSGGLTVPNPEKQSELIQDAFTRAQVAISSVSYIEAHGTGTSLGDPIEISALTKAFNYLNQSANSQKKNFPWCGIGSVKTNLGHLEAAAGMAGILKVLLSMKNKQLPATINFETLNSKIELQDSPFYIQNKTISWQREFSHQPLRAGVSSFGIGGTNAHVVIEEYVNASPELYSSKLPAVILLSAKNADRLLAQVLNLKNWLMTHSEVHLYDIAYSLQLGREAMEERLALVCGDIEDLKQQLSCYLDGTLKGHFRGNIKKGKSDFFLTDEAGHAYISYAIANKESSSLAQLWVNGGRVDWSLLYPQDKPNKISLPSYPFARERYWIPEQKAVFEPQSRLHPLLHGNISSLKEQKYASFYNGEESFLMDHRVNSQKILPGVAYLELAREAGSRCMESRVTQLYDVTWLQPVVINGSSKEVEISLSALGKDTSYEIYTQDSSGRQIHSQGILRSQSVPLVASYDLAAIQGRLLESKEGESCYELFRSQGLDLGKSFQGIQHFYYSENEALSRIALPKEPAYILSPGVLDSAIQTCIGLNFDSKNKALELPFSVREVTIYGDLPASLWGYARKSRNSKPLDKITSYDIDLLDDAGEVLVSLKDFVTLPLTGISAGQSLIRETKKVQESAAYLYDILWQPSPIVERLSPENLDSGLIFLAGGERELAALLKTRLKREVEIIAQCDEESYFGIVLQRIQQQLEKKNPADLTLVCQSSDYVHYGFISGLLRTAMQEHPKFTGKIIAVERLSDIEDLTAVLQREASAGDIEVRYLDGKREVKTSNPIIEPLRSSVQGIKPGGVYLITGGAGGLGLIFADYISRTKDTRIILTGRSELSAAGQFALSRIPQAEYLRCDVGNKEDVYSLIDMVKARYEKLDGILHSAGVLRDSFIIKKTTDEFSEVLRPKINGVKNLDEATREEALDFMVYFSSIVSVKGNVGQGDYASANAYLDNYASYRNEQCCKGNAQGRTLSINWPLWEQGGMQVDAESSQHMEKQWGMLALPTAEALAAFEALLKSDLDQGIVAFGKYSNILEKHTGKPSTSVSPFIFSTDDSSAIGNKATTKIIEMAARLLKLEAHNIEADGKLGDYGFDSILLTKFSNELNTYYDLDLMPTVFFNYPTIENLVLFLLEDHLQSLFKQHGSADKSSDEIPVTQVMENKGDDTVGIVKKTRFFSDERQHEAPVIGMNQINLEPIAIIGMSGRFPGSADLPSFWENIKENKDLITEIPADRWDWKKYYGDPQQDKNKTKAKWGGFIEDIDKFDPLFFNISPREAELMDPQQRITLQTVYQALEDAGIATNKIKGTNTGVFIGVSTGDYSLLLSKDTDLTSQAQFATGSAYSILVNRISYLLDIHGPSEPIDTACSSSLIAIHKAVENIRNGHCDMAIAGGVNALLSPELTLSFSQAGMLSEDGRCKSFDQRANGYVRGEGVGVVILKSLAKAEQDGDHIYGLIRASAENHGGKANTLTSPNPNAQKELLIKAYRAANIDPRDVSYIEAHGTGTPLGDPIEAEGLKSAFKELYKERNLNQPEVAYCGLGSVKANIGHLEAAAGMGGVMKVLLSLKHKILPGNPQLETPNEYLKLENSPFYLQKETKAWVTENNKPRIAGISSFGFGGANAHIIIQEYCTEPKEQYINTIPAIVVLSSRDQDRLKEQVANLKIYLENNQDIDFHDMVYTLQIGREPMEERLAIVSNDKEELIEKLTSYLKGSYDDCDKGIIFKGNARKDKLDFLLEGEAGRAYLQTAVKNKESKSLAQLWVKGISFDWSLFYPDSKPSKISLPTYPFHMKRYWFENAADKTHRVVEIKQNLSHSVISKGNGEEHTIDRVRDDNFESESLAGKRVAANLIFQKEKFQSGAADKSPNQSILFTKEQIASILLSELCALLYLEKEELESSKVFSELGLDSILGVELIKTVNKRFDIDLKVSKLYDYPSIAQLSNYLHESLSDLSEQNKAQITSANKARTISPVQPESGKLELVPLENYIPVSKTTELNIQPIGLLKIEESIETALPASAEKASEGGGAYLRKHLQGSKQINNTVLN